MDTISEIVNLGQLPESSSEIIPLITNEDGTFLNQEGTVWDFKESWPSSYSDSYFFGICRLICAFSNTEGGIIIFGVDDESRRPAHRRIKPNVDRLEQAFEEITGVFPDLELRSYALPTGQEIDVLLVRESKDKKRGPIRFNRDLGGYLANAIYIRARSQVREATSTDIASLYLDSDQESSFDGPKGQLPPSPATVREFVGRMDAIDRIFKWLRSEDEPRAFLYGKGGSGKSTIAYQVYKSIYLNGSPFIIGNQHLERLIFISAKERFLDVESQKSSKFAGHDFSNEIELYQAILTLGDVSLDGKEFGDISALKAAVKQFFNDNSCFVVIDDIDTLSTADEETGMDFLLGVLWRSKKPSKILYTLRNRPTQSIASSLEIPGLKGKEFNQFVDICADQFGVPKPTAGNRESLLLPISEGRPLVIESIVAIRRTSDGYPDAVSEFETEAGNDVRDYVFRREWDALDRTDRGREILALLALYNGPISVEDIITISRMDGSKVRDALAAVQEIFLTVESTEENTSYTIGSLTRAFVLRLAKRLDRYDNLKARVDNFKNTFYPDSPRLNTLKSQYYRAAAAARNGEPRYLTKLLTDLDSESEPKLVEDPRFLCLRASVRLTLDSNDISRARSDFETAMDFKHCPDDDEILLWFRSETKSDSAEEMTKSIVKRVYSARGYKLDFKARMKFERACFLFNRGKSDAFTDPHRAVDLYRQALELHLEAYRVFEKVGSFRTSKSEEYVRNTAFTLSNQIKRSREPETFLDVILDITKDKSVYADPMVEPLMSFMRFPLIAHETRKEDLQRRLGKFNSLIGKLSKRDVWMSKVRLEELEEFLSQIRKDYNKLSM